MFFKVRISSNLNSLAFNPGPHFRYDLGRDEGAVIDEWEDPGFEVYHKKDRYGFIQ